MKQSNLTKPQAQAYKKLSPTKWHSAIELECGVSTLNALVAKGYAASRPRSNAPRVVEFKAVPK